MREQRIKERVALTSIAASAALTIGKAVVGVLTGSLAILSEAGHSLCDLVATIITYYAVKVSGKPADEEHHYGHGKVESVSALAETALLFLLSGVVIWEAIRRLLSQAEPHVQANVWAFGIIVVSLAVDFFRARVLARTAARTGSHALEADALHFRSDLWSSLAVLVGLAGITLGFLWADFAAAIAVALVVCVAGWRLGRRTIEALTDTAPEGAAERIRTLVARIPGVVSVLRVRVRTVGDVPFADIAVAVSRTLPLDRVAALKERVVQAVVADLPRAEVTVTTEPRALDNETVLERVMVIARNRALAVHHVIAHSIEGRLAIAFDLEVDGRLSLEAAHEIASGLESAVRDELGPDVEVENHIEPMQPYRIAGRDAAPDRVAEIHGALADLAQKLGSLRAVHDVRVRETDDGEIVNFHCDVPPSFTVDAVHEMVDEVEQALRRRWPSIKRVTGHAEPRNERNARSEPSHGAQAAGSA